LLLVLSVEGIVYLLFVDESSTHGGSHSLVLGGLAVHEQDAAVLAGRLEQAVERSLAGSRLTAEDVELHATDLRNAKKPTRLGSPLTSSPWADIPKRRSSPSGRRRASRSG
jgi:hypothetical protein